MRIDIPYRNASSIYCCVNPQGALNHVLRLWHNWFDIGNGVFDVGGLFFDIVPQQSSSYNSTANNTATTTTPSVGSYLDIAIVPVPSHCVSRRSTDNHIVVAAPTSQNGAQDCDWTTHQGIGVRYNSSSVTNGIFYCCSSQAIQQNVCSPQQAGRLLVDPSLFRGVTFNVTLPTANDDSANDATPGPVSLIVMRANKPTMTAVSDEGTYVILMTNCYNGQDDHARPPVLVEGNIVVQSYTSTIELYLDENVPFYLILTILYAILWVWYFCLMRRYKDSRIRLEEWISITIGLGFFHALSLFVTSTVWEEHFYESGGDLGALQGTGVEEVAMNLVWLLGALLGSMKHALSRYLLVGLGLGWGVVHASIHPIPRVMSATLAIVYFTASAVTDVTYPMADSPFLDKLLVNCIFIKISVDLIFMVWIPQALCKTMSYLKRSNQTRKLQRYQSLLKILGLAVFLTLCLLVLIIVDFNYNGGEDITIYNVTQGNELNFFLILLCVAYLWRPNPLAREFVHAMEVSLTDQDDDSNYPSSTLNGPLGMDGREGYLADLELTESPRISKEYQHQESNSSDGDERNGTFLSGSASSRELT